MMLPVYEDMLNLQAKGLAKASTAENLTTFKYSRKVFYDKLWYTQSGLLDCRGIVFDNTNGKLVQAPPRKTFNYMESKGEFANHWSAIEDDVEVFVYRKINGFMACASLYKGKPVVSTTGTTTSQFAQWAKEYIENSKYKYTLCEDTTDLFEICHPLDPHIIKEKEGVHYLGERSKESGNSTYSYETFVGKMTFGEAKSLAKNSIIEGYMVYTAEGLSCKLKTPYYSGKKKLMRLTDKALDDMLKDEGFRMKGIIDKRWHTAIDAILLMPLWYHATEEQERRKFLENYEEEFHK